MGQTRGELLQELDSFRYGVLAALACIKAAAQNSPGFDTTVLEDAATYFLSQPPAKGDKVCFEAPLRVLLADRSDLLKALLHPPKP